ncbi:MAG: SipW-dependent-type signal peptide-containing protein [Candidatus Methanomethylophilaceae archaeon]|nr:SipW-dependent-type signal peptide-containing protein [Candidatus Methanomethylophilaceae archaeon]
MKTQTRAILASVVVIALALSAVSGVTYSWWSASENTEIEITTGYLDVDTSDFTMYDVTNADMPVLILEADDAPEKIDLASVISKNNTIGADSVLAPNGVDETYRIEYKVQFSANIYSKYIVGCTSTGGEDWILVDPSISNQAAANEWQYFLGTANSQNTPNGKLDDSTSVTVTVDVTLDDDRMPQMASERITITNQILQVAMPYDLLVQSMFDDGWDVVLNDDLEITESLGIPAGYNGVLDLNGFTITRNGPGVAIDNFEKLTIRGEGNVTTTDQSRNGNSVLLNERGATLVIEGGTYDSASGNALCNLGTAVVNGGTFTGEEYKIVDNIQIHGYAIASLDGSVTINDAVVTGSSQGAVGAEGGDVIVNGGSFTIGEHSFYCIYAAGGEAIINGGSFEKTVKGENQRMFYTGTDGIITIGAGIFKGGSDVSVNFDMVALSEGRVSSEIAENEYAVLDITSIGTAGELLILSKMVNSGMSFSGNTISLTDDIDMKDVAWTPIGTESAQFMGTFDGNGHTISNLTVTGTDCVGLFGKTHGGKITDLNIHKADVTGNASVSAVVGNTVSTILSDISVTESKVVGHHWVGGIAGYAYTSITYCTVTDSVITATSFNHNDGDKVGGIVGYLGEGNYSVSYNIVDGLTLTAYRDVGGIVGCGYANLAYNTIGELTFHLEETDSEYVGGDKSANAGSVIGRPMGNSYVTGTLTDDQRIIAGNDWTFAALISSGVTSIELSEGTFYAPASATGKNLTITGSGPATIIKIVPSGRGEANGQLDYNFDGSTVTFNNLTIETNNQTYAGYARLTGTYNNCVMESCYCLNGNSVFNGCTFNVLGDQYNIWTWGAPTATFNDCTFNSDGKAVLLYGTANTRLTINDCVFNDNGGLPDLKAAIEIGNDYNKSYELVVNNTTVNGYEINDKGINTGTTLWGNKNSMGADKLNVVVDGVDVY